MICDRCGREYTVPQRFYQFTGIGKSFCSLNCLRWYVEGVARLRKDSPILKRVEKCPILPIEMSDHSCYSVILGAVFRSQYEAQFAEVIACCWSWEVIYEYHRIKLNGSRKMYVPDFFQLDNSVWLEVKGEFHIGAKAKVVYGQKIVGADRLLLVGPQYHNEVVKLSKELRKRYGYG